MAGLPKTAGAVIDQMHSMSRSSALTLFRLIDPTFTHESISIKRFIRSIRLKHMCKTISENTRAYKSLEYACQTHVISSMDANGDGMISVDELLAVASKLTLEHIQKLFQLLQPSNGGDIKITDFLVKAQANVEVQKILASTPSLSTLCNPTRT